MNANTERGSAKIYQFPVGGRSRAGTQRNDSNGAQTAMPRITFGSSWYHEEAVQEAQPSRKPSFRFPTQ